WAIDRNAIQRGIMFGTGRVGTYYIPQNSWAYDPTGAFYTRDLAKAKAALAAGGVPSGFKTKALIVNIDVVQQIATAVKSQLAEVGIDMTIETADATTAAARRGTGDYEMAFSNAAVIVDPTEAVFGLLRIGSSSNRSRYSNPAL